MKQLTTIFLTKPAVLHIIKTYKPKGFQMKFKFPYNINDVKRMAKHALGMAAVFAVPFIACHKDPVPTPTPTPTPDPQTPDTTQVDTTTIIEPTYPDTVYLKWKWNQYVPRMDSVEFYANKNSVKKIIMEVEPYNTTGWDPHTFHIARDTLQKRINVAPQKVRGAGTIYVCEDTGAQMPDPYESEESGMAAVDSAWYVQNGWQIQRGRPLVPLDLQFSGYTNKQ